MPTRRFLVLSYEDGSSARFPVQMSAVLKFEVKYGKNFDSGAALDSARLAFRMAHDERWAPSNEALFEWFDQVLDIDVEEEEVPATNGAGPGPTTAPPPAQD